MKSDKKKNIWLLVLLIVTQIVGEVHLHLCEVPEKTKFIGTFFFATTLGIIISWFSYWLSKRHNFWHKIFHQRDDDGGIEPSEIYIIATKVGGWFLYAVGLFMALLPLML